MTSITTILGVRVTYIYRVDDLPYCEFIKLAERELGEVKGQLDILQAEIDGLPPLLVTREAKKALYEARAWYIDAAQEWSIWRDIYATNQQKGKAYLTMSRLVKAHNEKVIRDYHPTGAHRAEVYLAVKVGGASIEEAIAGVMVSFCLCDCWQEQRAEHWREVLS